MRGLNSDTGVALVEAYDLDKTAGSKFANVSTRGFVGTSSSVMIAGVIVTGPDNENVIIRGLGPTLGRDPFNVPNPLQNSILDLRDTNGNLIISNDNWGTATNRQPIIDRGLAPPDAAESAILTSLSPGNYTAILRGAKNATGNALIEVYALN